MNELCVCLSWASGLSWLPAPQSGSPSSQPTPKKIQLPAILVTGAVSSRGPELAASATGEGACSVGQHRGDGLKHPLVSCSCLFGDVGVMILFHK